MTPSRLAALCLAALPLATSAAEIPKPPVARVENATDTYFGVTLTDPYRWMEARPEPEFREFLEKQDAYTRATLGALPERDALLREITAVDGLTTRASFVTLVAGKLVYLKRAPDAQIAKLYIRDLASGRETMLVDPETLGEGGKHAEIDEFAVSPDATKIVYGVSESGSEHSVLHVVETATCRVLPEAIDRAQFAAASWAPDGESFFYSRLPEPRPDQPPAEAYSHLRTLLHRLGTDPDTDAVVLDGDHLPFPFAAAQVFPSVSITPGSDWAIAAVSDGVSPEQAYYAAPVASLAAGRGGEPIPWRMLADKADGVTFATVRGDRIYMLTHKDAPRLRAVSEDLSAPGFGKAAQVVAQPDSGVLTSLAAAADALYVARRDGSAMHVSRLPYGDREAQSVALPFEGTVAAPLEDAGDLIADPREAGALIGLQSWLRAPVWLRYEPDGEKLADTGLLPPFPRDLSAYEAVETAARAEDGTMVPLSIVAKKGTKLDGSHPTLIEGYGSYGISLDAEFAPWLAPWLDRGGVFAVAHVRGGGELGQDWHEAGKMATKQHTVTDLIDCAKDLIRRGYTTSERIAAEGGSAGGITVGGAITRDPGLFRAAVIQVGATNTTRAEFSPNGPSNIPEFGSVTNADEFPSLLAMDAYQHVKDGTPYPAVLLTGGFSDPRVEVWEPAKMAARLQAATSSGRPVLLRIEFDAGHGIGSTRAQRDAEEADEFAFLLWQFGQK
jgi:prolyl oligopeptidase